MRSLESEIFVCLDCETTGLDTKEDRIIEVAVVRFQGKTILDKFETLIDPQRAIPEASTQIHHITNEMCDGKPLIEEVLPQVLELVGTKPIIGHGIQFDLDILGYALQRAKMPQTLKKQAIIDTLRLARLYGEAPNNTLDTLRHHFNIEPLGAHRAMSDVLVNVDVFHHLTKKFRSLEALLERLSRPVEMKCMPLGKHKGRVFRDIPIDYLRWASHQKFDQDLLYSIRKELKRRSKGNRFTHSPFQNL